MGTYTPRYIRTIIFGLLAIVFLFSLTGCQASPQQVALCLNNQNLTVAKGDGLTPDLDCSTVRNLPAPTTTVAGPTTGPRSGGPAAGTYTLDDDHVYVIAGRQTQEVWKAEEYSWATGIARLDFMKELGFQPNLTTLFGRADGRQMAQTMSVSEDFELFNDAPQGFVYKGQVWFVSRKGYVYGQGSCIKFDGQTLKMYYNDDAGHGVWGTNVGKTCSGSEIQVFGPYDLNKVLDNIGQGQEFYAYAELKTYLQDAQYYMDEGIDLPGYNPQDDFTVTRVVFGGKEIFPFSR